MAHPTWQAESRDPKGKARERTTPQTRRLQWSVMEQGLQQPSQEKTSPKSREQLRKQNTEYLRQTSPRRLIRFQRLQSKLSPRQAQGRESIELRAVLKEALESLKPFAANPSPDTSPR